MNTKIKWMSVLIVLALVFIPTGAVAAQGMDGGQVVVADSFTLKSGETLNGDLVIIGGEAKIEESAIVDGTAILVGGSLNINGEINSNVLVIGGAVILGDKAVVHGNLTTIGASLVRAKEAVVDGEIFNTATSYGNGTSSEHPIIPTPVVPRMVYNFDPLNGVGRVLSWAIVLGLLAMLTAAFMAEPTRRVAETALHQPVIAGGLGLLTVVLLPLALVIMAITLILIIVIPLAALFVAVVAFYGWISLGTEVGVRLSKGNWSLPLAAGLGTFLMTLVAVGMSEIVPCIGGLIPFLLLVIGMGAVFMSRFGSQSTLPPNIPVQPAATPVEIPAPSLPEEPPVAVPVKKQRAKKSSTGE